MHCEFICFNESQSFTINFISNIGRNEHSTQLNNAIHALQKSGLTIVNREAHHYILALKNTRRIIRIQNEGFTHQ